MTTRDEALAAALSLGDCYADAPFGDSDWILARHADNRHAFAFVYTREGIARVNVKIAPEDNFAAREAYPAIDAAYHMNKTHWITITLDGSMTDDEIMPFLRESYRLTAKGRKGEDR